MAIDDLTQYKVCEAHELQVGDVLVNLGPVRYHHIVEPWVALEWHLQGEMGNGGYGARIIRTDTKLVREARPDERDHKTERRSDTPGAADLGGGRTLDVPDGVQAQCYG